MTAKDIINLLANKHSRDLFVPECKNGSTWFTSNGLRLDGWAMKRSWAHPLSIGYEVKTNRQDFINDNKWPGYLAYCNEFYFVCPPEIIQPNELGNDAGLYWTSKNGKTLYLKKKASYRDIEIHPDIYVYILMCRTKIVPRGMNNSGPDLDKSAYWKEWLKQKAEKRDLGMAVSKAIKKTLRDKVEEVDSENKHLRRENEALQDIKDFCTQLGITNYGRWTTRDKIREAMTGVPSNFMSTIDKCIDQMTTFRGQLNKRLTEYEEITKEEAGT